MPDESRIQQLMDEILESDLTPEEVCAGDPVLLRELRARWNRMQLVKNEIDELFPCEDPTKRGDSTSWADSIELPQLDGYDVQAVLGRGGMGVVFKAYQRKLGRFVALKTLLAGAYAGPQELMRFRREVEAIAALRHPNIVQIHEAGELDGTPYYTMEFVEGGSLGQRLKQSPLNFRQAAELVAILAVTVQFAHKSGIIHRDLKPANIMLTADGMPKITDFGLARFMNAETELTLGGARLGTPGYMAPEQAAGRVNEIGPAVDIYALGAILYRMLSGQPPSEGQTAVERERRIVEEEPQLPSRLNSKVPRDLETICLKCLKKSPTRRYASAQDLADDLHRFLDGKPILARPVTAFERMVKFARRRPAAFTSIAGLLVLFASTFGIGCWLRHKEHVRQREEAHREYARQLEQTQRENVAQDAVSQAIDKAYKSARGELWEEARFAIDCAKPHLANVRSNELLLGFNRAETEVSFVEELFRIREDEALAGTEGPYSQLGISAFEQAYAAAFAKAKDIFDLDNPEESAKRINASMLGEQIVGALEMWAFIAMKLDKDTLWESILKITLLVERLEHPEATSTWNTRFREAACWQDRQRLKTLAAEAATSAKSPAAHQLYILSALLRSLGETADEARLLNQAVRQRPRDGWLYFEIARMHNNNGRHAEAAAYLQTKVALRPENPWTHMLLSNTLIKEGKHDEGIATARAAIQLAPKNRALHHFLVFNFLLAGRSDEAMAEARRACEADPTNPWATFSLADVHLACGRNLEAIKLYRKTIELDPGNICAHCKLGMVLGVMRRLEEAAEVFRKTLELEPKYILGHVGLGLCYLDLRRFDEALNEFQYVMDRKETKIAEETAEGRTNSYFLQAREAYSAALLTKSRFKEASDVTRTSLEFSNPYAANKKNLQRYHRIGQQLAPMSGKSDELLAGKIQPKDAATQCALADWFFLLKVNHVAAVRLFEAGFQQQPALADQMENEYRFHAACAALLASCETSDNAKMLADDEKSRLRKKALEWLRADLDGWKKAHQIGDTTAQTGIVQVVSSWKTYPYLGMVRGTIMLRSLPSAERSEWQKFWLEVQLFSAYNPALQIQKAREQFAAMQWAEAAKNYSQVFKQATRMDDEPWFEFAATQLLSGDREGYRRTCKLMLEQDKPTKVRSYLVARACTLTPDSVKDFEQIEEISRYELQYFENAFWSLTEQGALSYRAKQYEKAAASFEESLRVETKPGAAVLNWLWLSMAHHQLKNEEEAKRLLDKACKWLDSQGNSLSSFSGAAGFHRHNWLEAHILRREAEQLILSPKP